MVAGYGPNSLITIRELDDEGCGGGRSLEQKSRTGVLGRVLAAVWGQLFTVNN